MVNRFKVTKLFDQGEITQLLTHYGLTRLTQGEFEQALDGAFNDYILSALSELSGPDTDRKKLYIEAKHYIGQAEKLLEGQPHPAGKMSFRLSKMCSTLEKLIEGQSDFAADRANRFMEKNLVRKLRDLWCASTGTPFHPGSDGSGRNPRDFILECFQAAHSHYPSIAWFQNVDPLIADKLIKSIRR